MNAGPNHDGRNIIVVDLSGTPDNRRVMRSYARLSVAFDTWTRRLRGRPGPQVLVFAPAADGKSVDWPQGADLVFTDELLDRSAMEWINKWVADVAARVTEEDGLWPSDGGICLGRLNVALIQEFLLGYAQVTESLRRVLDRSATKRCLILSGYPRAGHAMRRDTRGHADRIRVRALPSFRLPVLRRNRNGSPGGQWDRRLTDVRPRVLIVSESRPMAELFGAVENELRAAGIGPNLRVQYDSLHGLDERPDTSVLHVPRPELVQPGEGTDFRDAYRSIKHRLRELSATAGPYHPPLDLLFETLFANVVPRQVRHIDEVRRLIETTRPDLVVVGNDRWWVGLAYVLAAREAGIPTLAVQDGVAWDTPMWTCSSADHTAVNGTQLEGLLLRRGVDPERLTLVGQPRYDRYTAAAAQAISARVRSELGVPPDRFAVMFATQPNQDESYVRRVAEAILAVPDVQLLLRPHPSTPARARKALDRIAEGARVLPVGKGDIFDLIAASDLVVVQNSTVALEAALLARPVITANLTGMPDVVPYADLGVSAEAKDAAAVTRLVECARAGQLPTPGTDERARAGIHFLVGPTDGRCAERVADLIGSLLQRQHAHP